MGSHDLAITISHHSSVRVTQIHPHICSTAFNCIFVNQNHITSICVSTRQSTYPCHPPIPTSYIYVYIYVFICIKRHKIYDYYI